MLPIIINHYSWYNFVTTCLHIMQSTKFSLYGNSQQTIERHRLSAESKKYILTLHFNSKNVSNNQFHTYTCDIPASLKKISSTGQYARAINQISQYVMWGISYTHQVYWTATCLRTSMTTKYSLYLKTYICLTLSATHNLKWASYEYGKMTLSLPICTRNSANDQVSKGMIVLQYIHETSNIQELIAHHTIVRTWLFRVQS
jgi:hypothetical protein